MNYFNNPYAQQAYTTQYMQPSMSPGVMTQYGYGQQMQAQQMQGQMIQPVQNMNTFSQKIDFNGVLVNSFEDVKSYPVPIGGTILLLNKSNNKFYLKSLDDKGDPVIETYSFEVSGGEKINNTETENNKQQQIDYNATITKLTNRIDKLETRLNDYETSHKNYNTAK